MKKISLIILLIGPLISLAQLDINKLRSELDTLALKKTGLNEQVQISISQLPLSEFINSIAEEHNLNVSVETGLNQPIVNNFYDAQVKEVFLFLARENKLDVQIMGSIISFKREKVIPVAVKPKTKKQIDAKFNKANEFLSIKLKSDTLMDVVEEITRISGKNVGVAENIKNKQVSAFFLNRPFDQVLEMLCRANELKVTKDDSGFYFLEENITLKKNNSSNSSRGNASNRNSKSSPSFKVEAKNGKLNVHAENVPIAEIIKETAKQLDEYYLMYNVPDGNANLSLHDVSFEELLKQLLTGTKYTYKQQEDYVLIGERNLEGLRATEVIRLEYRTMETVLQLIPTDLNQDVEIKEFRELNGFVVSGSYLKIQELKSFLRSIDEVVPMVQIDVVIVYSKKGNNVETGVKGQIGDAPATSTGTVFPNLDVNLNSGTINNILNSIDGFGVFNLGQVAADFFVNLKALETNSKIDITQTPKIATLNGHEAKIDIGETTNYQENRVQVNNGINSTVVNNTVWKQQDASLSLVITPMVSTDEHVTLKITVDQSDFGGQPAPGAPLNTSTQHFESLVRVKNGEMILMGGLEKKSKSDIGEGTPILSRIPIIKWFFSSRKKSKEKLKTHVFIRPTVTY